MIIVAGNITVAPRDRGIYLDRCRGVIESARRADGCLDFYLVADPIDDARINVYEAWDPIASVEAFRAAAGAEPDLPAAVSASVHQHQVATSIDLTSGG